MMMIIKVLPVMSFQANDGASNKFIIWRTSIHAMLIIQHWVCVHIARRLFLHRRKENMTAVVMHWG